MPLTDNVKLTPRNAAALAKYAGLVGLTPERFLNRFLKDHFVEQFEDYYDNANAEFYLGTFVLKNRAIAERLAA